jgi:PAS domain S-box-containing protein
MHEELEEWVAQRIGQLAAANRQLEAEIVERKRAEEELRRAKAAAEAANEAKSQFLANMSHELRTPMNAILGMIDVALPKVIDPAVKDCLQTAKGSADLLLTLLDDLLDSAKIESGKLELESVPFSLRRMLDQITRVHSVRASEKGLTFFCRMPDETPDAVVGDRMRLQQVLINLTGNAIKFTELGEVEISLRVSDVRSTGSSRNPGEEPPKGGTTNIPSVTLEFAVRDTGIGIPPAGVEQLFRPFSQTDVSMARRFGGTGLGLAISKSLVELMGGRIWVESELGAGSTFYFTVCLPLAKQLPADYEAPVTVSGVAAAKLRILLVEDNPANQKLATYVLQDRGHVVEVAGDGHEAVCLAARNNYDVILMDVQMPGMNGLEATAAIRKREDRVQSSGIRGEDSGTNEPPCAFPPPPSPFASSRVPIIAMTAHAMKGDRDRCLAAGMDGYLSKPINALAMIALVETLAGGAVSSPPTPPRVVESPAAVVYDSPLDMFRRNAEQRLRAGKPRETLTVCTTDTRALLHELQVHQIELEMQNEELQRAQAAAEEASRRYGELFDFAPVAYFLWDHQGRILEVNLAGAALLGLDRDAVIHKRFGQFVGVGDRAGFAEFCARVQATDTQQTCMLTILKDGQAVDLLVEGIATQDRQGQERLCRAAAIDISQPQPSGELATATPAIHVTEVPETMIAPAVVVFNPELALARCFNSQNMVREMVQSFLDEADNSLPQMRAALEKGELVEVGRLGHRMKGTLVYIGAEPAKEAVRRVERLCQPGDGAPADAEEAVNALQQECEALRAALVAYQAADRLTPQD